MRNPSPITLRAGVAALVLTSALGATAASAQTPPVSGAVTGPGIEVGSGSAGGPTGGESAVLGAGGARGGPGESPISTGIGEAVLGVQARQLPRTGGFALDPVLVLGSGVALSSLGFYFRSGRKAQEG
jgi:hypothetical protein